MTVRTPGIDCPPRVRAIKPIETYYRGYRFRSRLEARWAVFFQTLGVPWEYEPQGFVLSTGERYLPDFRVRLASKLVLWVEVKPEGIPVDLFEKFINSAAVNGKVHGTVLHDIPDPNSDGPGEGHACYMNGGEDWPFWFCICTKCGGVGFEYNGWSERIDRCRRPYPDKLGTSAHPRIIAALRAARAARFEHGECG